MEKKLEYTQEILRGLAIGDLASVAEKGEQMRLLSKVEGWIRNRKPGYRDQFQAFEFANAEIVRNAKANNLDGAAMAFQQLTTSCVSCHKLLRDVGVTSSRLIQVRLSLLRPVFSHVSMTLDAADGHCDVAECGTAHVLVTGRFRDQVAGAAKITTLDDVLFGLQHVPARFHAQQFQPAHVLRNLFVSLRS